MALPRVPSEMSLASRETNEQLTERDEGSTSRVETKAIEWPVELVNLIFAMIPFPAILKTRLLNKSWYSEFSPIPKALPLGNQVAIPRALTPFQSQVQALSSRWKHYCPIRFKVSLEEWIMGYDRESRRWRNIFKARHQVRQSEWEWLLAGKIVGAGSLVCAVRGEETSVYILNIVTRDFKRLPSVPDLGFGLIRVRSDAHLLPIGSDAYQVLLIRVEYYEHLSKVTCDLYDSQMESWTVHQSALPAAFNPAFGGSVYLDGVLYTMAPASRYNEFKIQSYNVEDGIGTNLHNPFGTQSAEIGSYKLLVCQNRVMVVLEFRLPGWNTYGLHRPNNIAVVYRLDPVSLDVIEIARRPLGIKYSCSQIVSDNESIYFVNGHIVGSSFVEYNLQSTEWSTHPPPPRDDDSRIEWAATFPLHPGRNPFVSV